MAPPSRKNPPTNRTGAGQNDAESDRCRSTSEVHCDLGLSVSRDLAFLLRGSCRRRHDPPWTGLPNTLWMCNLRSRSQHPPRQDWPPGNAYEAIDPGHGIEQDVHR